MGLNVADAKVQNCQTAAEVRALSRAILKRQRARFQPPRRISINDMTPGSFPLIVKREIKFESVNVAEPIKYPSIASIIDTVCRVYRVTKLDMVSKRRDVAIVFPRQIAQYLACRLTPYSLPAIGKHFGGRDHTTVLNSRQRIEHKRSTERKFDAALSDLESMLGGYNPQIKIQSSSRQIWSPEMDARLIELIASPKTWLAIRDTLNREFGVTLARTACFGRMYTLGHRRPKIKPQPLISAAA